MKLRININRVIIVFSIAVVVMLIAPAVLYAQQFERPAILADTMNFRFFGNPIKGDTFVIAREIKSRLSSLFEQHASELREQQALHDMEHLRWRVVVDSLEDVIKKERDRKSCPPNPVPHLWWHS